MRTHLRVVLSQRPPFVYVFNSSETGKPSYTGLLIDLFQKILAYDNHSFTYEYYESPSNAGGSLTNGVWTGIAGELVYDRADVALFPLTRLAARMQAFDCTFSYLDDGLTLLVQSTVETPGPLSVLEPFAVTLWVTILCTVVAVALLFWGLDLYGRWIRAKQIRVLQALGVLLPYSATSTAPPIRARKDRYHGNHVMTSFTAAAGAPERPFHISWGGQVLYIVYCFFCLIVLSSYTANLTSFLAVQRADDGISGLQDVIRSSGSIAVNANGSTAAYFATSLDSLAMQLQPSVRTCDDVADCVDWVRSGTVTAYVGDSPALKYLAMQRPCDLAVAGEPFGPGNLVIGLQKNSPLLSLFNAALQEFNEDGVLTELRRTWFDNLSHCGDASGQVGSSRLTISQMLGAFVFLAMGVLAAFVTGTIENLKWCLLGPCCGASVRADLGVRLPPAGQRGEEVGRGEGAGVVARSAGCSDPLNGEPSQRCGSAAPAASHTDSTLMARLSLALRGSQEDVLGRSAADPTVATVSNCGGNILCGAATAAADATAAGRSCHCSCPKCGGSCARGGGSGGGGRGAVSPDMGSLQYCGAGGGAIDGGGGGTASSPLYSVVVHGCSSARGGTGGTASTPIAFRADATPLGMHKEATNSSSAGSGSDSTAAFGGGGIVTGGFARQDTASSTAVCGTGGDGAAFRSPRSSKAAVLKLYDTSHMARQTGAAASAGCEAEFGGLEEHDASPTHMTSL